MIKALPMVSTASGRAVANQYIIRTDTSIVFQSYTSTIAVLAKATGRLTLGCHFDYSRTTVKYLHQFIDRYASGNLRAAIDSAPGSSYAAKLQHCIDCDIIDYKGGLV